MKKIAYTDFWPDFDPSTLMLTRLIHSICEIEDGFDIGNCDYLLYSVLGNKHWFAPDSCVKIFYTGECVTPDFNACDYAIGFDYINFNDRYFRLPLYYLYENVNEKAENRHINIDDKIVKDKLSGKFCSMTISNSQRNSIYIELFKKLNEYKIVDSGGRMLNNIGGAVDDKAAFDYKHKFSIVCENSSYPGYTTEKLIQALSSYCVPIYWGDPLVGEIFNKDCFIDVNDFKSFDGVVEKVKEIDSSDDMFLKCIKSPIYNDDSFRREHQLGLLKSFLKGIFDQPIINSYRRNRDYQGKAYILNNIKNHASFKVIFRKLYEKLFR